MTDKATASELPGPSTIQPQWSQMMVTPPPTVSFNEAG